MIDIQGISKSFDQGRVPILKKVGFTVHDGELVALLGPSGSGKTTLLRIIAGLETADSGQILFDGHPAQTKRMRERQVGFVFQHYALFRHMTVFNNVAFGLRVKPWSLRPGRKTIGAKVNQLLELVQISELSKRYPSQLSGGQRQRVALARALAIEPKILLLDEPFGALDANVRQELRVWLRQLHDSMGLTSIFVTHDQEEAMDMADRVVLLEKGILQQIDRPENIYEKPANFFAYQFLGQSNQLLAEISGQQLKIAGKIFSSKQLAPLAAPAFVYLRPYHIRPLTASSIGQADFTGRIDKILFGGSTIKLHIKTDNMQPPFLEAEIPPADVADFGLVQGQTYGFTIRQLTYFASPQEPPILFHRYRPAP